MEELKLLIRRTKVDKWAAALLAGATCGAGIAVLLIRRELRFREGKRKIQRARERRTESVQRAEEAVLRYKETHPTSCSALILTLTLSELTKQLQEGLLSPEDVFYTYMEKALDVNKQLNCCTEILLESFDQLKTLDSNKKGLLYGVPVSIKDNIEYKNHDCSCGVVINLEQPLQKDGVLVEVLKRQGAIPFVKTNLPQALLNFDCSNPIYGQTVNPHNHQKTAGGSSGGEGALIGGGGSVLGLGSDIGGSIRIPAAFCGICGLKPTACRLSTQGVRPIYRGQKSVLSCPGPMARDVDSLALCMQALLSDHMFSLDPTVPPLPFNVEMYRSTKPLRIGYCESDGHMQSSPSTVRALREVKALLEQAGHTFVPYSPLNVTHTAEHLLVKGVLADGAATMLRKLEGSPLDPCLRVQISSYGLPRWMKKTIAFLLKPVAPRISSNFRGISGLSSIPELWEQHAAVEDYIHETIEYWRRCNIDVLLCPMFGPAFNFQYCGKVINIATNTILYNLLTFPAGVVPVTTATEEDEEELKHYKGIQQDRIDKLFKMALAGGQGLPMAVQCVALPWQDELCLRFMKEVEHLVQQSRG